MVDERSEETLCTLDEMTPLLCYFLKIYFENIRVPKVSKSEAANFSNTWAEFDTTARRPQRTAPSQILWEDALA